MNWNTTIFSREPILTWKLSSSARGLPSQSLTGSVGRGALTQSVIVTDYGRYHWDNKFLHDSTEEEKRERKRKKNERKKNRTEKKKKSLMKWNKPIVMVQQSSGAGVKQTESLEVAVLGRSPSAAHVNHYWMSPLTPSTAFRHLPPNRLPDLVTSLKGYSLSQSERSALRKVRPGTQLWKQPSAQATHVNMRASTPPGKKESSISIQTILVLFELA